MSLRAPPLPIRIELPADAELSPDLRALPARPGVFLFEDDQHRTITIGMTADLRRLVRARLTRPKDADVPSRRVDYRSITRTVRALTVGSAFEADWAYLQLARERMPRICRALLDRWCGWFIQCEPSAEFPRFTKRSTSEIRCDASTVHLGPFADKHSAQRAIDQLEGAFDLCRYHHLLVEAPRAAACAYKEMGRCPAPCDGSIPMSTYRETIREAVAFASEPWAEARAALEGRMRSSSDALDFETAARQRRRLDTLVSFGKPACRFVDRIERFRFVAVLSAETADRARVIIVSGGRIEPWADIRLDTPCADATAILDALEARVAATAVDTSPPAIENIGLVCWHLFRPSKARGHAALIPCGARLDRPAFNGALRSIRSGADDKGPNDGIDDAALETYQ